MLPESESSRGARKPRSAKVAAVRALQQSRSAERKPKARIGVRAKSIRPTGTTPTNTHATDKWKQRRSGSRKSPRLVSTVSVTAMPLKESGIQSDRKVLKTTAATNKLLRSSKRTRPYRRRGTSTSAATQQNQDETESSQGRLNSRKRKYASRRKSSRSHSEYQSMSESSSESEVVDELEDDEEEVASLDSSSDEADNSSMENENLVMGPVLGDLKEGDSGNVLFYGDSLTWGMAHNYTGRYQQTWPRLVERHLNAYGLRVIESALCSRTTAWDDPGENDWMTGGEPHYFNGLKHFATEFISAAPSWLVILLGTNDLKVRIRESGKRTRVDASFIASNCAQIALKARELHSKVLKRREPLKILLIAPPLVRINDLAKQLGYDDSSAAISKMFPEAYRRVCRQHGFLYTDMKEVDMRHSVDGIHITEDANRVVARKVLKVFNEQFRSRLSRSRRRQKQEVVSTSVKNRVHSTNKLKRANSARAKSKLEDDDSPGPSYTKFQTGPLCKKLESSANVVGSKGTAAELKTYIMEQITVRRMKCRNEAEVHVAEVLCTLQRELPAEFPLVVEAVLELQGKDIAGVRHALLTVEKLCSNRRDLFKELMNLVPPYLHRLGKFGAA